MAIPTQSKQQTPPPKPPRQKTPLTLGGELSQAFPPPLPKEPAPPLTAAEIAHNKTIALRQNSVKPQAAPRQNPFALNGEEPSSAPTRFQPLTKQNSQSLSLNPFAEAVPTEQSSQQLSFQTPGNTQQVYNKGILGTGLGRKQIATRRNGADGSFEQVNFDGTIIKQEKRDGGLTLTTTNPAKNKTKVEITNSTTSAKTIFKTKPTNSRFSALTGKAPTMRTTVKKSIPIVDADGTTRNIEVNVDPSTSDATITTPQGQKVTYKPNGSYTIEGKISVVRLTIDADGQPHMESYNKGDWTTQKISSEQPLASQGLQKSMLGHAKAQAPKITTSADGSVEITTSGKIKGQEEPVILSKISIDSKGNIKNFRRKNNSDEFETISETTVNPDGTIEVTQSQNNGEKIQRVISQEGNISTRQTKRYPGETRDFTVETYNNGPEITTTTLDGGVTQSQFIGKKNSQVTVKQDNFTLSIDRAEGKSLFGTGLGKSQAKTIILDFSSYLESPDLFSSVTRRNLKSARSSQAQSEIIDAMTVKLTGESDIIQTPQYKDFKDSIINELQQHTPPSKIQWLSNFVKRVFSLDTTLTKVQQAIQNQQAKTVNQRTQNSSWDNAETPELETTSGRIIVGQGKNKVTIDNNAFIFEAQDGSIINFNAQHGSLTSSTKPVSARKPSGYKQITTVNQDGEQVIITLNKDNKTPMSKAVIKQDGNIDYYTATSQGAFSANPTSRLTRNNGVIRLESSLSPTNNRNLSLDTQTGQISSTSYGNMQFNKTASTPRFSKAQAQRDPHTPSWVSGDQQPAEPATSAWYDAPAKPQAKAAPAQQPFTADNWWY